MQAYISERPRLTRMAARMLGSAAEAEEAVQEAGLRLARQPAAAVDDPAAWLTTTVSRLCLDVLRARKLRGRPVPVAEAEAVPDPARSAEDETLLAEGVGLALRVVLDRLAPGERVAFVLHDIFEMPFDTVARILGRSPQAARQLASRARRRVQGASARGQQRDEERRLVAAFYRAVATGNVSALMEVLAPEVQLRTDGADQPLIGAASVAARAQAGAAFRGWVAFALVGGRPGLIAAPQGRLAVAMRFGFAGGRIATIDVIRGAGLAAVGLALPSPRREPAGRGGDARRITPNPRR